MIHALLLPLSVFWFILSERLKYIHQSRVGQAQELSRFIIQNLINVRAELGKPCTFLAGVLYALQISFVACVMLSDLPGLFYLLCALHIFIAAIYRIYSNDELDDHRSFERIVLGTSLAIASSFTIFSSHGTWVMDVVSAHWALLQNPLNAISFLTFIVSGLMMFDEAPFLTHRSSLSPKTNTVNSVFFSSLRFYVWSLLTTSLFLGGDDGVGVVWLYFKSTLLYMLIRLLASYFQNYKKRIINILQFKFLIPSVLFVLVVLWWVDGIVYLKDYWNQ